MNYTTRLTLKSTWFKLIKQGHKKEEYRTISPYYQSRFCARYQKDSPFCQNCAKNYCQPTQKVFFVHFTLGYPRVDDLDKHMVYKVSYIRKGYGRWLWGANPGKKVFILDLEREVYALNWGSDNG